MSKPVLWRVALERAPLGILLCRKGAALEGEPTGAYEALNVPTLG